ncbi:tetratricopeptide repeat protein [Pseudomonas protegens]|uniref:tetratricopeptide repeat protein n=1 Tax=Pseudomonas protegens TaxID=380021 RepID=UPI00275B1943|nr:tetratricopeptide repeat protein [Pseudomonas protegens]MDP9512899.1 tetratricopeptide repeat protein [Pseudomonas protegens]
MDHFNNLPTRHKNHVTESKAEAAFQNLLSSSEDFVLQAQDRKDYGSDCQIEVVDHESATNVRIHVQLKGTEGSVKSDGSISVEIRRSNLNYLLMQPHSLFVCYHVPTATLRFCSADTVMRQYEHSGQNWTQQKTLTVSFLEILTESRLKSFAALARTGALSLRDMRITQAIARPEDLPGILKNSCADLHVPEDEVHAAKLLSNLYNSGADEVISAAFDKFASILSLNHDAVIFCYMAEINLGMAMRSKNPARLADSISYLSSKLNEGRIDVGSLHYSIGNAFSALGREEEAANQYETALYHLTAGDGTTLFAECYKNLGSSYEKLGDEEKAAEFYRESLRHNSQLPEAHYALGLYCLRKGEYQDALSHFDSVVFAENALGKRSSVSGWRINALFNLCDGRAAFREINTLLSDAGSESWIWPWCSQQVANFGRCSLENAKLSIPFWDRYLSVKPNCSSGVRERLMNMLYLHSEDTATDMSYIVFKREFEASIRHVNGEPVALLWDRLGHWAQEEDNWEEAERCFRIAYDLEGGHYGYCLGTALNFLSRPHESLPILLLQAEEIQQDYMSWFQVAVAYEKLNNVRESVSAYMKAIALNSNYELAWFNMGGVYWNAGEREEASRVWKVAVYKFPDHELAAVLRHELPFVLL